MTRHDLLVAGSVRRLSVDESFSSSSSSSFPKTNEKSSTGEKTALVRMGLEALIEREVIGELATGNLAQRKGTLRWLGRLPRLEEPSPPDCLAFIEQRKLFGLGIGWNDVQLLAAAAHSRVPVWSLDRKLTQAARRLQLA